MALIHPYPGLTHPGDLGDLLTYTTLIDAKEYLTQVRAKARSSAGDIQMQEYLLGAEVFVQETKRRLTDRFYPQPRLPGQAADMNEGVLDRIERTQREMLRTQDEMLRTQGEMLRAQQGILESLRRLELRQTRSQAQQANIRRTVNSTRRTVNSTLDKVENLEARAWKQERTLSQIYNGDRGRGEVQKYKKVPGLMGQDPATVARFRPIRTALDIKEADAHTVRVWVDVYLPRLPRRLRDRKARIAEEIGLDAEVVRWVSAE